MNVSAVIVECPFCKEAFVLVETTSASVAAPFAYLVPTGG